MTYFFSYDVTDTRRRNQISKALEQFGLRVQKSVFQCDMPAEKAEKLKNILLTVINKKEDSLLFYPVCDDCVGKARLIGDKNLLEIAKFEIL